MSEVQEPCRESERAPGRDPSIEAAWARWAPFYDLIYAAWLGPGRRAGAVAASKLQGPILNVGVGTGLELSMFGRNTCVFGVDLSEPMLRRAVHRARRGGLSHVTGLACMDAMQLAFPDSSFGCALLMYVLTVTPEPRAVLDEVARVIRPGGEIIVVSRISPEAPAIVTFELWFGRRFASQFGWRPYFPWEVIAGWLEGRTDMLLVERRRVGSLGLFTLTRIRRTQ